MRTSKPNPAVPRFQKVLGIKKRKIKAEKKSKEKKEQKKEVKDPDWGYVEEDDAVRRIQLGALEGWGAGGKKRCLRASSAACVAQWIEAERL